jgi:hypothetical protein
MSKVKDERTNPMGLFNYAHSYWVSAVALQNSPRNCTYHQAPVDYLYFHAIKPYLKSFLRLQGMSLDQLKRIGHSLAKLYAAAVAEGLTDDEKDREVIGHIDANYMRARYIETGPFTTASSGALWGLCRVFHDDIEPQINRSRGVARKRVIPFLDDDEE